MSDARLHPAVEPLAFLLGRWLGEGKGEYPTIEPFVYDEEIEFSHTGRPFLFYVQKTWNPADGYPMHAEAGYVRPVAEGVVELVLAQPSGITEILAGTLSASRLDVTSTLVGASPTAKQVSAVRRVISVDGTALSCATIATFRSRVGTSVVSSSSKRIRPSVGASSPAMRRRIVDFHSRTDLATRAVLRSIRRSSPSSTLVPFGNTLATPTRLTDVICPTPSAPTPALRSGRPARPEPVAGPN